MQIWVDADACPKLIKDILYRAADRVGVDLTLVANHALTVPSSPRISVLRAPAGFDAADKLIGERVIAGDLVVTADIPLAAEVLEKGALALNPRGERYTPDTIRERLTMRDFLDTLRGSGIHTGGPPVLSQADRLAFANQLDAILSRYQRERG